MPTLFGKNLLKIKEVDIPTDKNVKQFIAEKCPVPGAIFCRSHDEAIQKLEAFFRNLPFDQWGRFKVVLSLSGEEIELKLRVGRENRASSGTTMTKTCFLVRSKADCKCFSSGSGFSDESCTSTSSWKSRTSDLFSAIVEYDKKLKEIREEKQEEKEKWKRWELSRNRMTRVVMGIALGVLAYLAMESYK
ncbi:MAG: hypothetical protein K1060chlam1_00221 [Candidatus Anoxychlamydiales bacterium]|nr:hypothetical protein [Candidatus Anoxychlamydiales bacterium]